MAGARPIICAVDDSAESRDAPRAASWLAREADAPLTFVHVLDPTGVRARDDADQLLEATARSVNGVEPATELREGPPLSELQAVAEEHHAALLVTGTAARSGLDRILIGSVASELAARAPCPLIAVAPGAALEEPGPVLAGYDGSEHSLRAGRHAAALAARLRRDLVLLHVVAPGDDGVRPDAALAQELHAAGMRGVGDEPDRPPLDLKVSLAVEDGDPVDVLANIARERAAAIIFTGTRGRNALSTALLGSVSVGLVRTAARPVGLVPSSAGSAP